MPDSAQFKNVFVQLKSILNPYAESLDCKIDQSDNFYLDTKHIMKNGKPLFFGAVQIKKNYVSYHLMPVYVFRELLENISPQLKRRMQGKSCFNFTKVDTALFEELAELSEQAYQRYHEAGYV